MCHTPQQLRGVVCETTTKPSTSMCYSGTSDNGYYGNLHNMDKRPRSRIIPYSSLYRATSVYLPTPNYGQQSHAPTDKINTNLPLKADSLNLHV